MMERKMTDDEFASSSQNANHDPIKEQFRACREHATQEEWEVVATYDDPARSGLDLQRPGLQAAGILRQDANPDF
jgi:DNA invertase Pin-like site-specific DNA recombinase